VLPAFFGGFGAHLLGNIIPIAKTSPFEASQQL
jgi:hypothetical protein